MAHDDLYRFRSFGPAPPRKPHQRSWSDPEKLRESREKQAQEARRRSAEAVNETGGPANARSQTSAPKKPKPLERLSEKLLVGKWAHEMLEQGRPALSSLRGGEPEPTVREHYPKFFGQVFDAAALPTEEKERLMKEAKTRHVSGEVLLLFLAQIKKIKVPTLRDYLKDYRKYLKTSTTHESPQHTPKRTPK
jgi:hypothetical protein